MRFETSNLFAFLVKSLNLRLSGSRSLNLRLSGSRGLTLETRPRFASWDFEVILNQYDGLHWLPERNKMEGKSIKWLQKLFFIRKSESYRGEAGIKHVSQTTGTVGVK